MNSAEEVKSRLDIVDVIREYIELKPAGTNWKGLCPFHGENTPSFMVSKPKQIWHCFGCSEGGDMFSFVMKQEGLEFPDALRLLASKAGVVVKTESPQKRTGREKIGRVLALSVAFWEKNLWTSEQAKPARQYLQDERLVLPETVREWHIGFALDSWEALVRYLSAQGITEEDMIKAGVAAQKMKRGGRGAYDRFRNRIVFPLTNAHGQVVGLTARAMPGSNEEAKYVNTPETELYHKGSILYGLDRGKSAIRQHDLAVIVEGNVDVISSHQADVKNVVASSGTALTPEQVRLLKRHTNRVAFSFDTDAAGQAATLRGLLTAIQGGLEVLLVPLPVNPQGGHYKDPDECIRDNSDLWKQAVADAVPVLDYYFAEAEKQHDMQTLEGKRSATRLLLPIIAELPDQVAAAHYLQKLASLVQVPESSLREALKDSVKSASQMRGPSVQTTSSETVLVKPNQTQTERYLAGLLKSFALADSMLEKIDAAMLAEEYRELYKTMVVYYTNHKETQQQGWQTTAFTDEIAKHPDAGKLINLFNIVSLLAEGEYTNWTPEDIERDVKSTAKRIRRRHLHDKLQHIEQSIRIAEQHKTQDPAALQTLLRDFQAISAELVALEVD